MQDTICPPTKIYGVHRSVLAEGEKRRDLIRLKIHWILRAVMNEKRGDKGKKVKEEIIEKSNKKQKFRGLAHNFNFIRVLYLNYNCAFNIEHSDNWRIGQHENSTISWTVRIRCSDN